MFLTSGRRYQSQSEKKKKKEGEGGKGDKRKEEKRELGPSPKDQREKSMTQSLWKPSVNRFGVEKKKGGPGRKGGEGPKNMGKSGPSRIAVSSTMVDLRGCC